MSDRPILEVGVWRGTLDALLQAVRRHSLDLRTLPLTELIEQFLACIEESLRDRPLEQAADDLVLAATLVQMRSALLLRNDTADHAAAFSVAEQIQLILLRKEALQRAVELFEFRPVLGESVFARGGTVPSPSAAAATSLLITWDLLDALLSVSRRRARLVPEESVFRPFFVPRLSVQDAMASWREKIQESTENTWDLVEDATRLSPGTGDQNLTQRKAARAINFLAVLELARRGELRLKQLTCREQLKVVNARASMNH